MKISSQAGIDWLHNKWWDADDFSQVISARSILKSENRESIEVYRIKELLRNNTSDEE